MKKIFYFIAALTLSSAVSCMKEKTPAPSSDSMIVTLGFDGDDTKATLSDKWGITWSAGLTLKWDGGSHKIIQTDIDTDANTVSFEAEGLEAGEIIASENTVTYDSYTQNAPGSTNWTRLFLKGIAAEAGKVTTMQIDGSILRFIPYANDEAAKAESVKSVTIEGLDKTYTVTLAEGKELSLAEITSKAASKSIYLPLAAAEYDSFKVTVLTLAGTKYVFASGAGKSLTLEENSIVNMSLPLEAKYKLASYSVKFETDGGSEVSEQTVADGGQAEKPEGVTKKYDGSLPEGLYLGVQNPDKASYTLEGWYTDAAKTQKYDFSTPVTGDLTLYAKWVAPEKIDISSLSGSRNPDKAMAYVNALDLSEKVSYTYVVKESCTWQNNLTLNNANVDFYLVGAGEPRSFSKTWDGNAVTCKAGHFYLGNNITITGTAYASATPIYADGGNITLLSGSKVSGCVLNGSARAVCYANNSVSTITVDGGEVVDNTITFNGEYMVAAVALNWGKIDIKSGKIARNIVTSSVAGVAVAGGVYAPDRTGGWGEITKTGGVIEDNVASFSIESGNVSHLAQQVLFRAVSQTDKGIYKIDENIPETVSFKTSALQVSPWVKLEY